MTHEPYVSFSYLTPGVDYKKLDLAPEFDRVPAYDGKLSEQDAHRAARLLHESLVISLHDHPVRFPADMRETPVRIICAASLLLMVWATWRFIRALDFEAMRRR